MSLFGRDASNDTPKGAFGCSPDNPILCEGPSGEHDYIRTLRCPSGHGLQVISRASLTGKCRTPAQHRDPMWDMIEYAKKKCMCKLDCYDLTCSGREYTCRLHFDMYHPGTIDDRVPEGLTRVGLESVVAVFNATTGWAGRRITLETGRYVLEGHGIIREEDVQKYDSKGQLDWMQR